VNRRTDESCADIIAVGRLLRRSQGLRRSSGLARVRWRIFVAALPRTAAPPSTDPIDADFTPLAGCELLERPGPELTIWELPGPR
jgi:hypothetical protein